MSCCEDIIQFFWMQTPNTGIWCSVELESISCIQKIGLYIALLTVIAFDDDDVIHLMLFV